MFKWIKKYILFGWIYERNKNRKNQMNNPIFNQESINREIISPGGFGNLSPQIKQMFDALTNPISRPPHPMDSFGANMKDLGEPDEIETISDGGITYEKYIWKTPNGTITKIEVKSDFKGDINEDVLGNMLSDGVRKKKKSLEEKLKIAIEEENYEEAAKLRDEIDQKGRSGDNWEF